MNNTFFKLNNFDKKEICISKITGFVYIPVLQFLSLIKA